MLLFFCLQASDGPPEIWIAKYAERVHLAIFLGFRRGFPDEMGGGELDQFPQVFCSFPRKI